jgi:hypothetical protein
MAYNLGMAADAEDGRSPIVVAVSEDRTGATFAIGPATRRMLLRTKFGSRPRPRIFIAYETRETFEPFEHVYGHVLRHIAIILTGVSPERLHELGPIEFRESVTERVLGVIAVVT